MAWTTATLATPTLGHAADPKFATAKATLLDRTAPYSAEMQAAIRSTLPRQPKQTGVTFSVGRFQDRVARGRRGGFLRWQTQDESIGFMEGHAPRGRGGFRAFIMNTREGGPFYARLTQGGRVAQLRSERDTVDWNRTVHLDPVHVTETADVVQLRPGRFVVKYRVQANGKPLAKPVDEERILYLELASRFGGTYHDLSLKDLWAGKGPPPGGRDSEWGHGERLYQAILTTSRAHVLHNVVLPGYRGNYIVHVESGYEALKMTFPEAVQFFRQADKIDARGRKLTPAQMERKARALIEPFIRRLPKELQEKARLAR